MLRQLTFSSFVFKKSYDNYIPSGSWYIWHLENIDLHNQTHMGFSDQTEVWLLSFSWFFSHCIINATARFGGSYYIELRIRSSLGKMTIENQERDLSAKGSSAAYHPSVSTPSMEVKAVWQFVQSVFEDTYDWCHRQYKSLTNWSQML